MFSKRLIDLLVIIFIFNLVGFYFWPNVIGNQITFPADDAIDDLTEMHYPMRDFMKEKITQGQWPLWTDKVYTGFPLAAQGEMGAFYPPNLVFAYFLTTHYSIYASIMLSFFLAGVFYYLYLKKIRFSGISAFFGAVVFTFTGFFLAHQVHINHIATVSWFPLALILIEYFLEKRKLLFMLLLGLVFALAQLAGGNQLLFYIIIFCFVYSLVFKPKNLSWLVFLGGWALAAVFTISLTVIQILPTLELVRSSSRAGGMGQTGASFLAFPFTYLINFFLPYFHYKEGNTGWFFFERYVYFGLIPWLLAGLAGYNFFQKPEIFNHKKAKYFVFFSLSAVICLAIAFGYQTFLKFLFELPGFNFFRIPSKFLIFTQFCLITLAVFGFDILINKLKNQKRLFTFILYSLILIAFLDIYLNDRLHVKYSADKWFSQPETADFIKSQNNSGRVIWTGMTPYMNKIRQQQRNLYANPEVYINLHNLIPNLDNLLWNLPTSSGYSGGIGIYETSVVNNYLIWLGDQINEPEPIKLTDKFIKIARLTNSRYLLTTKQIIHPKLKEVYKTNFTTGQDNVRVYEFDDPQPRVFLVDKANVLDHKKVFAEMLTEEFQPDQEVILEENLPESFLQEKPKLESEAEITSSTDEKLTINTKANKNALLFVSDTFYPGWQAYIDEKPSKIYRADYAFRAVAVPEGQHTVEFKYQPKSFYLGRNIAQVASVLFFITLVGLIIIERKK